jgi:crotonobetainyl-CoA:carnitine CoA-transferase CaiB-like acyl-CoA transferase
MSGISPLEQFLVVDFSTGVPGGYCTKMLADAGAEVVKLEPPEGDPLRRWSASGARIAADDDGALFDFLGCSKRSVVIDPTSATDCEFAHGLLSRADAVVWSPGSRLAEHPGFSPTALRQGAPGAVVTSITPFGLGGPWSQRAATEFTLQAWSGGIGPRGTPDRAPVSAGGRPGEWLAGMFATVGILAARHRTLLTGIGELLDFSILESLILTQNMYPATFYSIAGRPHRRGRGINLPAVERTKDGWVGFMIVTAQQWQDFCLMVERPDWFEDKTLLIMENRNLRRSELQPVIASWMVEHTTREVVARASLLRLPVAEIGNGATVTCFDHLVEKNFYVRNPRRWFPPAGRAVSFRERRRPPQM